MPTAVERLLDSFFKYDGHSEQLKLENALSTIDDDLLKLSNANGDNFLKIEHDSSLKLELQTVGEAFIKLSADFQKVATAEQLIDQLVVKLNPGSDPHFLDHKIDTSATDLRTLGLDFLKLHTSPNLDALHLKLDGIGLDALKLSVDMNVKSAAFMTLGDDFIKLGGETEGTSSPFQQAYKIFGDELHKVGGQFQDLASDFLNYGTGGGEGKVGLKDLFSDFQLLNDGLATLGGGANALIGLLHPSNGNNGPPTVVVDAQNQGPVTLTGISDTTHHHGG